MDNVEVELVDPLVDPMFKLVFEKEEYLASLISSVVEQFGITVKQVQKMNTELVGFSKYAKHPVMDVLVTDQEQRLFDVEIQVHNKPGLGDRILQYATGLHSSRMNRGEDYADARPVIVIVIMNFNFWNMKDPLQYLYVTDPLTGATLSKNLQIITIELPKINNRTDVPLHNLSQLAYDWCKFLSSKTKEEAMQAITAPEIEHAVQDWLKYNTDPELRPALVRELHHIRSYNTDIRQAHDSGLQQGLQQKQLDIARSLSQLGVDPTIISQGTGLSLDEISDLS